MEKPESRFGHPTDGTNPEELGFAPFLEETDLDLPDLPDVESRPRRALDGNHLADRPHHGPTPLSVVAGIGVGVLFSLSLDSVLIRLALAVVVTGIATLYGRSLVDLSREWIGGLLESRRVRR